jgi:hypothetical protein
MGRDETLEGKERLSCRVVVVVAACNARLSVDLGVGTGYADGGFPVTTSQFGVTFLPVGMS